MSVGEEGREEGRGDKGSRKNCVSGFDGWFPRFEMFSLPWSAERNSSQLVSFQLSGIKVIILSKRV